MAGPSRLVTEGVRLEDHSALLQTATLGGPPTISIGDILMVARNKREQGDDNAENVVAIRPSWGDLNTTGDVEKALIDAFGTISSGSELLGNEFEQEKDKDALLGVPFAILEYGFSVSNEFRDHDGNFTEFAWIRGIRLDNMNKVAFSDGSTGIYQQLKDFHARTGRDGGIVCKRGLRVSRDYDFVAADGSSGKGTTYYLDN